MSCRYPNCVKKVSIIGTCKGCERSFCLKHRLPEDHVCEKQHEMKDQLRKQNMDKLKQEQTKPVKI